MILCNLTLSDNNFHHTKLGNKFEVNFIYYNYVQNLIKSKEINCILVASILEILAYPVLPFRRRGGTDK